MPARRLRGLALVPAVLLAAIWVTGCGARGGDGAGEADSAVAAKAAEKPEVERLRLGVIAIGTADEVRRQWEKTARDLGDALGGTQVELVTSTDYFAIVEGLKARNLDVAALGSLSYVLGKQRVGMEPLVVGVDKDGQPGYFSYLITRKPAEITSPADVKGRRLALAGKLSTSGFLFPSKALKAAGVDPARDTMLSQGGNHAANVLAVQQGAVEAAFVDSVEYDAAVKRGAVNPDEVSVVWRSERITGSPMVARADLDPAVKEAVRKALLTLEGTAEHPLGVEKSMRFVEVDDSAYEPIRVLAAEAGLDVQDFRKP